MLRLCLSTGDSRLVLVPDVGGGIGELVIGGRKILRGASPSDLAPNDPLLLGEFPMTPWVNRVAGGAFVWRGQRIDVSGAPVNEALGLHGFGWRMPWRTEAATETYAELALDWPGGAIWPLACRTVRRFWLTPSAALMQMEIQNRCSGPMPAALGWHPYFPSAGATLQTIVAAGWATDSRMVPSERSLPDVVQALTRGAKVSDLALDTCFDGWSCEAHIHYPTHQVAVRAEGCGYLQIYTPSGTGHFCLEPQTAMPDALNRGASAGLRVLAPGRAMQVSMRLELKAAGL